MVEMNNLQPDVACNCALTFQPAELISFPQNFLIMEDASKLQSSEACEGTDFDSTLG